MGFFRPNIQEMQAKHDVAGLIKWLSGTWGGAGPPAKALADIGGPAVPALIAAIKAPFPPGGQGDERRRVAVCRILGQIGDPSAVEPLYAALYDPTNHPSVYQAAAEALIAMGVTDKDVIRLIRSLGSKREQDAAAKALADIGGPAVPALIAAIKAPFPSTTPPPSEFGILGALVDQVNAASYAREDERRRVAVCRILGQIGDPSAVEPLHAALNDQTHHPSVYQAATEALRAMSVTDRQQTDT